MSVAVGFTDTGLCRGVGQIRARRGVAEWLGSGSRAGGRRYGTGGIPPGVGCRWWVVSSIVLVTPEGVTNGRDKA